MNEYRITEVQDERYGDVQKHIDSTAKQGWVIISHNIKFREIKSDKHVLLWSRPVK